jgi:hypothetical protein
MASSRGFDPNSELVQADILGTGLGPNDSQIDNDAMGPVNVQLPTPDYAQTDPMVDGVEAFDTPIPPPPPGSIARHIDIDVDGDSLATRNYSMMED